jgi:hypothetical protein
MVMQDMDVCGWHDRALAEWYRQGPPDVALAADVESLVLAQHLCNFTLWHLEDEARRTDVDDFVIAGIKRSIDQWNQTRNDRIEEIDTRLLAELPHPAPAARQHSETAGQMIDRLSILALKVWHMNRNAERRDDATLAAECGEKLAVLHRQRDDLAVCLRELLADCRAGRRFFKLYRQFKTYNDPRLNPALGKRT